MIEERKELFNKEVSVWQIAQWEIESAWSFVSRLPRRIARMFSWIPFLWSDQDFDYSQLLRLMQYKMKRMRKHFVDHDMTTSVRRQEKQLKYAEFLINEYFDEST